MARPFIKNIIKVIVIGGVGYYGYGMLSPQGGGGWGPQGPAAVSVAKVESKTIRQWYEFSGKLVAVDQAEIRPRVSGAIEQVLFTDGAMVKKGDALFVIDPRPYQTTLQSAIARATLAESEVKRSQTLLAEKAIPQREYDQKKNDVEVARADLARAKLDLEYTKVLSPITGRVSRAEITKGNMVDAGAGAPLLATVVTASPIYADFEIDETTYLEYAKSQMTSREKISQIPVAMTLGSSKAAPRTGHLESFDNRISTGSGTLRVRAVFDNTDGVLVPGLFAHIKLGGATESSQLLITDRAVGTDQSKKFVHVVGADNKAEHREIMLGAITEEGLRVVTDGLKEGEQIIVSGMQRVMMPGQEVKPELVAMDAKEPPPAQASDNNAQDSK
jgi:membrane fusion protein, multidrug efflux system